MPAGNVVSEQGFVQSFNPPKEKSSMHPMRCQHRRDCEKTSTEEREPNMNATLEDNGTLLDCDAFGSWLVKQCVQWTLLNKQEQALIQACYLETLTKDATQ